MGNGSGISRGDRNRNARLERLRGLVPVTNAIAGVDLAGKKQMVVVTDHGSKVIARKTFRCRAWDLGPTLDWAAGRAAARGWVGVTVACEPTGHRWRVLGQLAADRGMPGAADHRGGQPYSADAGPAGVRVAGGAGHRPTAVQVGYLDRVAAGSRGARRRGLHPDPPVRRSEV